MAKFSKSWMASISIGRNGTAAEDAIFSNIPVMPFIQHRVHPRLAALLKRIGIPRKLSPNEPIFGPNEKVDHLVYLVKGVTARAAGNLQKPEDQAIALSTPGHTACGNLNMFTGRPTMGRYYAITEAEVLYCPHRLIITLAAEDPTLYPLLMAQLELATLTDRLGFACIGILSAEDRMKAFGATWAMNFGEMVDLPGIGRRIKMPVPLTRSIRIRVTNTSLFWLDKTLAKWKQQGVWDREGEWVYVDPDFLEPIYQWLRDNEEKVSDFVYPSRLSDIIR